MMGLMMREKVEDIVLSKKEKKKKKIRKKIEEDWRKNIKKEWRKIRKIRIKDIKFRRIDKVGIVEKNEVGGMNMIIKKLIKGDLMVKRLIGWEMRIKIVMVVGKKELRKGGGIDKSKKEIKSKMSIDIRKVEGGKKRMRKGKKGGLDKDMVGKVLKVKKICNGRNEIIGKGEEDEEIIEIDEILIKEGLDKEEFKNEEIEEEIEEIVDNKWDEIEIGILKKVEDNGCIER